MKNNLLTSTIPFAGFYESAYSFEIENTIERETEYYSERFNLSESESETLESGYLEKGHGDFLQGIAKDYCEGFLCEVERETGIELKAQFEVMESPREYNFRGDTLFIQMPEKQAIAFIQYVISNHKEGLERLIKERFTSQSGFISFYDNTLEAWGDPSEWDCNQLGTCFEIFAYLEGEIYDAYSLYESISNGLGDTLSDEASALLGKCFEAEAIAEANEKKQLKLAF
jgi:hypothetical protein